MRKNLALIVTAAVVTSVAALANDEGLTALSALSAPLRQAARELVKEETDYYLERHNVDDEGYELVAAFANGQRLREEVDTIPLYNVGRWRGKKRQGTALSRDSLGRIIIGRWRQDTLVSGIRIDSGGIYQGAFAPTPTALTAKAQGHGSYLSVDGHYYEGRWDDDHRQGFGLQLLENGAITSLKVGEWLNDRYQGERMNYTSERIYGIDISRYQHGKGRRHYPIQWNRLRISHLGSKSKKQISGTVDYPVQFCYIKSTEGVSIRNPYFAQDYAAARRNGIHTGAYHFFSWRTSGEAQAAYFIKNTRLGKGDLPPVLDVEPSAAEIARMGGPTKMLQRVRTWLQTVERHCGTRPILYVNQKFVNNYLPEAPDIRNRYGEYRPDVRLAIWQLSPDGRVRGITGEVDINVFNGYQQQFDDFIDNETIR